MAIGINNNVSSNKGLTFEVVPVIADGSQKGAIPRAQLNNGNTLFRINVVFQDKAPPNVVNGQCNIKSPARLVGFEIEAKSLKVALEMIQAYGQQIKPQTLDQTQFDAWKNKSLGKDYFFTLNYNQDASGLKEAKHIIYRRSHSRNDIVPAFGGKHGGSIDMVVKEDEINAIKRKAKKYRAPKSAPVQPQKVHVKLEAKAKKAKLD